MILSELAAKGSPSFILILALLQIIILEIMLM
jgi:hypothetical protein